MISRARPGVSGRPKCDEMTFLGPFVIGTGTVFSFSFMFLFMFIPPLLLTENHFPDLFPKVAGEKHDCPLPYADPTGI
jgi:hypothetical protein